MTGSTGPDAELVDLQERHAAAWRAHDPDAVIALHAPDAKFRDHGDGEAGAGRTALREAVLGTFVRFPEFRPEPRRLHFGSDHWVLEWTLFSGEIEFDCVDVVVVSHGLIATRDTYFDAAQLAATTPRPG